MLKESKADIFVDPVLHTACALDIKHHCAAITPGRGRRKSLCSLYVGGAGRISHQKAFSMPMVPSLAAAHRQVLKCMNEWLSCLLSGRTRKTSGTLGVK